MEQILINLPYNSKLIHKQIVKFMNFAMDLTNQEQLVLAKLIEYNINYEALDPIKRATFILSTSIKKEICTSLDIKSVAFAQILLRLKKKRFFNKPILDEDGVLNERLLIKPDKDGLSIAINFKNDAKPVIKEKARAIPEDITIEETTTQSEELTGELSDYTDPTEGLDFEVGRVS